MNRCRPTILCLTLAAGGCGVLEHLIGVPEPPPPLEYVAAAFAPLGVGTGDSTDNRGDVLTPAVDADPAVLAGIWVHGDGLAAVHIDESGWVYQFDRADNFDDVPDFVPRILFNVGRVSLDPGGTVVADLSASMLGVSASANVTGILDETFSIIYAATTEFTYNLGQSAETTRDFTPWFRWTE